MSIFLTGVFRFRLLVLAAAVALVTVGVVQLRHAPLDVLPEFTPPYAEIQTEALGLSAEEVEQLITVPLEADLLNGVEGVDTIRSSSVPGLSSIVLVFEPGTDVYRARQLVEERLTQAHALPNVSRPPTLLAPLSSSNRVLMIGMSTTQLTPIEQSVIARWTVRPRLMGVPGVANVAVWGMRDQQLQVQVDPEVLRDQKVTLSQVINTSGNAQVVSPLSFLEASTPGTGGFIETPQQRLQVRHLLENLADPAELAKVPVEGTGGRLQLGDVATITVDHQPLIGDAIVGDQPGLLLVVEKFPGVSTTDVTNGVEAALETLRPGLTGIDIDTSVFRPADYVTSAQRNLGLALLIGGALMLVALLLLGFQWRTLVVAAVTIPLSLLAASLVLRLLSESMNALVFAGLAAAGLIVVDEAVTPTAEVTRRVRSWSAAGRPGGLGEVTRAGLVAARIPLIYATLIALVIVVPLAMLDGRPGAFFRPMVLAYVLAITAALVAAVTVTPALLSVLFSRWPAPSRTRRVGRAANRYEQHLVGFRSRRALALLLTAGGLVLFALTLPNVTPRMVPSFTDRNVLIRLQGQPGTSNARMTQQTTDLTRTVRGVPGVATVAAHVGRAVTGDRVVNVNSSDVWVSLRTDADYSDTIAAIEQHAAALPGVASHVTPYTTQKLRDVGALTDGANRVTTTDLDLLTGLSTPIAVRLYGQDPVILAEQAERVQDLMAKVDGVVEPVVQGQPMQPTVEIEVDLERAQAYGVSPGDVRRAEATLLQGVQVGSVFEQQKVFDVIVQGTPETRRSVAAVRNLLIDRPGGGHVRLGQVADVRVVPSAASIERDAVSRRLDIVTGVNGRSVAEVAADLEAELAKVDFPMEYHAEVLHRSTADEIGSGRVAGVAVGAVLAVFLLLQAAFRSWRLAALVFATLPVSLAGGVLVMLFTGGELTLGGLLGLLVAFGLATRFAVALVGRAQSQSSSGADTDPGSTVHQAARARFGPVVTTSVAVAALAAPMAVLGRRAGLEIISPLAVVLLGALVSTAGVALFVLPALYGAFADRRPASDVEVPARSGDPSADSTAPPRRDLAASTSAGPPTGHRDGEEV